MIRRNEEVPRPNDLRLDCGAESARPTLAKSYGRTRRRFGLLAAAIALTGCATTHTRWVQTYCVTPDQYAKLKQAEPGKIGSQLDGNAQHDLKLIAGNDLELRTFSDGLLGVIGSCVDPNTEARP